MPIQPHRTDPERLARWAMSRRRVGQQVRSLRLAKGMTQERLALESGMSRNQLMEVEHGRAGLLFERLEDLADVLGVSAAAFFPQADEPQVGE